MEAAPRGMDGVAARPIFADFSPPAKFGVVGLPSSGKSTLVRTIKRSGVSLEHEANIRIQKQEFDLLCDFFKPKEKLPATIQIVDTPSLVRGSHFGAGIGNTFLEQLREADGLIHICRTFEDSDISHVDDKLDPIRDLECVRLELQLKDVDIIERKFEDIQQMQMHRKKIDKEKEVELNLCLKALSKLREGNDIRLGDWEDSEVVTLKTYNLLTAKAVVYLINISKDDYLRRKNKFWKDIRQWVKEHGDEAILPFCGALENELFGLPENAADWSKSMSPKIINTCLEKGHIIHFFTANTEQVKCWQVRRGTSVAEIVRWLGRGTSSVEVVSSKDIKDLGIYSNVKARGGRKEWMTYVIKDGDLIFAGG